jgi:DNA-binding response OmpR family regulator
VSAGSHHKKQPKTPWGTLPPRLKALYVVARPGASQTLADALATDCATKILLTESVGGAAGMARLQDEVFDAVLVHHQPGVLDALELVEGLRTGGTDEPILVLGADQQQEMAALCFEVGADDYCCLQTTTTRSLLWTLARAIQRHELVRENRRLQQADRQRLQYEHQEAERLLAQQRVLVEDLERDQDAAPPIPKLLVSHYREMLRAYVIMGSGNLATEMSSLAEMLVVAGVTARQTMHLHVQVLEELIRGLGNRSARHVISRADLLVVEVMVQLCEGYRAQNAGQTPPAEQLLLPGFQKSQEALREAA